MTSILLLVVAALVLSLHARPPAAVWAQQVLVIDDMEEGTEDDAAEVFADVPILQATPLAAETVDGVPLTVVEVSRPCLDPWAKPPAGHVWVCLLVTMQNLSEETREYGPGQLSIVTSEHELARPVAYHDVGDGLQEGLLPPGGALVGLLRFEMAEHDNARLLRFASAPGRDPETRDIPL